MTKQKKAINHATGKKVFWENAKDEFNIKQVFVTENDHVGMTIGNRTVVQNIESWFRAQDMHHEIIKNLDYERMNVFEKIAYWYVFERKISTKI